MSLGRRPRLATARKLVDKWGIPVSRAPGSAFFHRDGEWFNELTAFPGALLDPEGYIVFESGEEYRTCPDLQIGKGKTNVKRVGGISSIAGYIRVPAELRVSR